jgi:hypothetical protein
VQTVLSPNIRKAILNEFGYLINLIFVQFDFIMAYYLILFFVIRFKHFTNAPKILPFNHLLFSPTLTKLPTTPLKGSFPIYAFSLIGFLAG